MTNTFISSHKRLAQWLSWGLVVGTMIAFARPAQAFGPPESAALGPEREASSVPVPFDRKLSSPYGWRMGRTGKARLFHFAVDFAAGAGTPVFAVRGGIVAHVAKEGRRCKGFCGYGNAVVVYHEKEDVWTLYAHLSKVGVEVGQKIRAGAELGAVGATCNRRFKGMGAHLHFEVRERLEPGDEPFPGKPGAGAVDPQLWLASLGVVYDKKGRLVRAELSISP
ncbi:MAG: M23 family metallopeptidase [Myxococcota bacterium]|nr:M23 family metallopeptidase [Myxococcota bacterium]